MRRSLALLLVALPLAACGGGGSHVSLAQAATKSTNTKSMKMDMTMGMTTPQLPQPVSLTATGAADNANKRVQMSIDMSSLVGSLGSTNGGLKPSDFKGEEVGDLANGRLVIYMRLPFLTKLIPNGKPWIKIDLNSYGKSLGIDFSQFTSLSANPVQMVDWLRATSGSITKEGTETIDGVQTTHYHATVDLSKYPNLVPPERRPAMRRAVNSLIKLAHVHTFPMDAWIGADNLVRKLHIKFTETVNGQSIGLDMTMHFHDFGAPVSISLPPADQTVDLSKIAGQSKP